MHVRIYIAPIYISKHTVTIDGIDFLYSILICGTLHVICLHQVKFPSSSSDEDGGVYNRSEQSYKRMLRKHKKRRIENIVSC